jgi:hypothetical protein
MSGGINFSNSTGTFLAGFIPAASDTRADAGAVSIDTFATKVTTTGAAAITLADGVVEGQHKLIVLTTDGGDATLTPATLTGGTTITFADVGDTAWLVWSEGSWVPILLLNLADGSTAPVLA